MNFALERNVVGFFPEGRTLKSGLVSHWYANWRTVTEDVYGIDRLSRFVLEFVDSLVADKSISGYNEIVGVPEGATKLAVISNYIRACESGSLSPGSHPLPMMRGQSKRHGDPKDMHFLGVPTSPTVILEDVTTTGGSLLESVVKLLDSHIIIGSAITLLDRLQEDVKSRLKVLDVPFYRMSTAEELLPLAYQRLNPGIEVARKIEAEYKGLGRQIKLV